MSSVEDQLASEIFLNKPIHLNHDNTDLMSHDRDDLLGMDLNMWFLLRDFVFSLLYWFSLWMVMNDILDLRFIWLSLWGVSFIISLLCHIYSSSPPFYSLYRGSDIKYDKYFKESAAQYITEWNGVGSTEMAPKETLSLQRQRTLTIKLCWIGTFGGLSEPKYGFIELKAKNIENKSDDNILQHIAQQQNKLIRLRVYHSLRFRDHDSYEKFLTIFKDKKSEFPESQHTDLTFHVEYNLEVEERLLMNTTNAMSQSKWNDCCTNRKISYIWYIIGLGFVYRFYHEYYINTRVYLCVKEIQL